MRRNVQFKVLCMLHQTAEDMAPPETVQIHNSRVSRNGPTDQKFGRWEPVVILNRTTGGWTIRHARGGQNRPGMSRDSIVLDYDGWVDLAMVDGPNDIVVRPAKAIEVYRYYWRSKQSLTRITTRLAVLGVLLGVVGLLLGVVGLLTSLI